MRIWPAVVLVLLTAPLAAAQPAPAATLPPIGLPLPSIGLPLPPLGLAPPTDTTTPPPAPRQPRGRRRAPAWPWVPVIVYVPGTVAGAAQPGTIVATPPDQSTTTVHSRDEAGDRPTRAVAAAPPDVAPVPDPPVPAPPGERPVSKPLYFVPGCYLGDVPPERAGLPASCDLSKTIVYRP